MEDHLFAGCCRFSLCVFFGVHAAVRPFEAGMTFKGVSLKPPLTRPGASVFFQLECGDGNVDAEQELPAAMKAVK